MSHKSLRFLGSSHDADRGGLIKVDGLSTYCMKCFSTLDFQTCFLPKQQHCEDSLSFITRAYSRVRDHQKWIHFACLRKSIHLNDSIRKSWIHSKLLLVQNLLLPAIPKKNPKTKQEQTKIKTFGLENYNVNEQLPRCHIILQMSFDMNQMSRPRPEKLLIGESLKTTLLTF